MPAERPSQPRLRRPTSGSADPGDTLRYLAETDAGITGPGCDATRSIAHHGLDERTAALARLAALLALSAAPASYQRSVDLALAAGATVDDVVNTLRAVACTVGLARAVSAAPGLALALGYNIDDALETLDDPHTDDPREPVRVVAGESRRSVDGGVRVREEG